MIELEGEVVGVRDKDSYRVTINVDGLTMAVARSTSHEATLARRVGQLAFALVLDFLEKDFDNGNSRRPE